jgi:predicted GNAT family acetyltransferase
MTTTVDRRDADDRFEIRVDGTLVGFTQYVHRARRYIFVHTEIDPGHEREGLGSTLIRGALDAVRAEGERIVPLCPFVAGWIDKHPDYCDLVDHDLFEPRLA